MNTERFKDGYETYLFNFLNEFYVECPACAEKAYIKNDSESQVIKITCINCGYNKTNNEKFVGRIYNPSSIDECNNMIIIGNEVDPFFHFPLWLSKTIKDKVFWAYNYDHLNFLENYISSKLRERTIENMCNSSLGSRLPKWMSSEKNRELIIKTIAELYKK